MAEQNQKYPQFRGQPRLPKFAIPKRYDLKLNPDLAACKFTGAVQISVDVVSDTKFLVLNAAELSVSSNSVKFASANKVLEAVEVELFAEDEIVVMEFKESLPIGVGVLTMEFEGTLNDNMNGFYRSTYEHNGEKKNMAVTQFEPVDARRCFPCWDEPACKATFKITLDVPSDLVALSNMPITEEKQNGNLKTIYFQESPIMSTYLVAVVVGMFDYVEDNTPEGINVRVYCQVGKSSQGKFALDVAVKTLGLYKEYVVCFTCAVTTRYFDVPYSLPKLDMIAIPDFAPGAMENYGLVTYRETDLLYDENHSAAENKQMVVTAITHELAHQWFGNLVTMEWWTHLWLNEGFATWISYLAADSLFPDWKVWTQFLVKCSEGLQLDGLAESHPIEVDINHASEVGEIFDAISYQKGASVIRMLQSYLGPESFQVDDLTEDLWSVLLEESGEPVNKLMNSWTKQMGYPVVSVKLNDQSLEFEQSRFLFTCSHGNGQWVVPITLCSGSYDARKSFLLETKSKTLDVKDLLGVSVPSGHHWIKVNVEQTGFYRVKYDEGLSAGLRKAIERKYLSTCDRSGILDDYYSLSMSCEHSLTSLLALMSSYREELEYTVASTVAKIVADASPELVGDVKLFFINLFQNSAEYVIRDFSVLLSTQRLMGWLKLGWDPKPGESHLDSMLRGELLKALAIFGHEATLDEANKRFRIFLEDRNTAVLPPDLRSVNKSNKSGYDSLLRIYRETDLSQEKTRILGSLGSCRDPEIVQEFLDFLLSSEVRSQDVVVGVSVCRESRETAWNWLKANWDNLTKTYGSGFLIAHIISNIVSPFSSYEKAAEVEEFFSSRMMPNIARTVKQGIERIHINAAWVKCIQNDKDLPHAVKELAYSKY
ncbi:hypothetical protein SASPL_150814 [Salvia splendens]|uniref:Aminopeptidase n=1 Tax=Salvia splendens TaxID=180675 RepID=A0A8X8W7F8_SALSN|nr:hypothetical protein SASPL_150814 [Salvia splendens]